LLCRDAQIPTFGKKNSLNVASACPVVVFEALRQWKAFPSI
jgi:tRNA(Leu) C34 or U34 (ribose-2'-O)-methylase TrmL